MSGSYENTHKRRFIGAVLELCVLVVADDYSFCSHREIKKYKKEKIIIPFSFFWV